MTERFIEFYKLLKTPMEEPLPWGSYHILCIVLTVVLAAILIKIFANAGERTVRILTFVFWLIIAVLEVAKQLSLGYRLIEGELVWKYAWNAFPYQFCSTPLYIMPLVALLKDGKARDFSIVFLSTFSVVGGVAVFLCPDTVFSGNAFLNIQTMVHHGTQIFFGAFLAIRYRDKLRLPEFLGSTALFLFLAFLAFWLDVAAHEIFNIFNKHETFNMFFISPYSRYIPSALAGMGIEKLSYESFILYFLGIFIGLALTIMIIMRILARLTRHH